MSVYRPGEVATKLGIAAPTLRRWSVQFCDFLSESAGAPASESGSNGERRYSESDIALLRRAQALLDRGLTFDETREELEQSPRDKAETEEKLQTAMTQGTNSAIMSSALAAKDDTIMALKETVLVQKQQIALLEREIRRLEQLQTEQRERYLAIIRQMVARVGQRA